MAEYDGKGPKEEHQATGYKVIVNSRDNTSHDTRQTDDAQSGHQRLNRWEALALRISIVQKTTDTHGDNRHNENIQKHTDGINLDNLTSCQLHEQWCHHGSE